MQVDGIDGDEYFVQVEHIFLQAHKEQWDWR